jgi:hypothetical protein
VSQLIEFIKSMGDRAKKPFRDELSDISKKILGREPEYYDDFYFFRNRAFSDMETNFLAIDPLLEVKRILDFMDLPWLIVICMTGMSYRNRNKV